MNADAWTGQQAAPAKINLALHVLGQREDGFHYLDSLVAFCKVGDYLTCSPREDEKGDEHRLAQDGDCMDRLVPCGPFGRDLEIIAPADNLVLRAAQAMRDLLSTQFSVDVPPLHFSLEKNLPIGSGVGGGSTDAAATMSLMARCRGMADDKTLNAAMAELALTLGADIPVCLRGGGMWRMRGIGEELQAVNLPAKSALVLVNPRVSVSTAQIFTALEKRDNAPLPDLSALKNHDDLCTFLRGCRNDLEQTAAAQVPQISAILRRLESFGTCDLARMSGSGATCFGLFEKVDDAREVAETLAHDHQDWWIGAGSLVAGASS